MTTTTTAHAHRWRIAEPNGTFSTGHCECGVEREFPNSEDAMLAKDGRLFNGHKLACVTCGRWFKSKVGLGNHVRICRVKS